MASERSQAQRSSRRRSRAPCSTIGGVFLVQAVRGNALWTPLRTMNDRDDIDERLILSVNDDVGQAWDNELSCACDDTAPSGRWKQAQALDGLLDASDDRACGRWIVLCDVGINVCEIGAGLEPEPYLHTLRFLNRAATSSSLA